MRNAHSLALCLVGLGIVAQPTTARADEPAPPAAAAAAAEPASSSDEPKAKNAVFFELLGNGILYSLNYDRRLNDMFSVRGGLMYFSVSAEANAGSASSSAKASLLLVPLLFNVLLGGKNHKFELGAGPLIAYASAKASGLGSSASDSGVGVAGTGSLAYRYSPSDGGFFLRAGLSPVFGKGGFLPWPGVGLGAVF